MIQKRIEKKSRQTSDRKTYSDDQRRECTSRENVGEGLSAVQKVRKGSGRQKSRVVTIAKRLSVAHPTQTREVEDIISTKDSILHKGEAGGPCEKDGGVGVGGLIESLLTGACAEIFRTRQTTQI